MNSSHSTIHVDNPWFEKVQYIRRQNRSPILPNPQTEQIQNCRRCGNKILQGHLNICPAQKLFQTKFAEYAKRLLTLQNFAQQQKCHHAQYTYHNKNANKTAQEHNHNRGTTNWHQDKHSKKSEIQTRKQKRTTKQKQRRQSTQS